jgi:thioredoxin reductase (NADPH)
MEQRNFDFIIVGAGVAGLTAAIYSGRSDLSTLILDSSGISGGQALNILNLENYPGCPAQSGSDLAEAMEKQAKAFGAAFSGETVQSINKDGGVFTVSCAGGKTFSAPAVLLASGGSPRTLGVPGEKEFAGLGVSYCATCDGPFFRGKHVAVVGGGNSACDEALYLSTLASRVTLIHRRDTFRADPLSVSRVQHNEKISIKYDTVVQQILGDGKVSRLALHNKKTGAEEEYAVDGVFIFAGFIPESGSVPGVTKDAEGHVITGEDMQTSVPGLFCAGDVRSKPLRQIVTAAADGAIAAHSAGKYLHDLTCGAQ